MVQPSTMPKSNANLAPAVSVSYGKVDVELVEQDGKDVEFASLDRAVEILAQMPDTARRTLMAPIEQGLINPQSVFYLIDDKTEGEIAISVEDFVHLTSCFHSKGATCPDCPGAIPSRLVDALLLMKDEGAYAALDYAYPKKEQHDGQPQCHAEKAPPHTERSNGDWPAIPRSRPPPIRSISLSVDTLVHQQHAANRDSQLCGINDQKSSTRVRCTIIKAIFLVIGVICILAAFAVGIFLLLKRAEAEDTNPSTTSAPFIKSNATYDCVNGSIAVINFDCDNHRLVDLNLTERKPTASVLNREFLLVSHAADWWQAHKYCRAWCGYLVSIRAKEDNELIRVIVSNQLTNGQLGNRSAENISYWIGTKGWLSAWYLDDETEVTYFNFPDQKKANQSIGKVEALGHMLNQPRLDNTKLIPCTHVDINGTWYLVPCSTKNPFICERNIGDPNIQRTPFHPHQSEKCATVRGRCQYAADCIDGHVMNVSTDWCPLQASNIVCCVPSKPKPALLANSSAKTCTDAGGTCNHAEEDECRDGRVIFKLPKPCPDHPTKLDCCVNE